MAQTSTDALPLGALAPPFELNDVVSDRRVALDEFASKKALLVMFLCRHCPYVVHVQQEIANIARAYIPRGVGVVAIGSNDAITYPDDSPLGLRKMAEALKFEFPYLYDESQAVARAYGAACTPEFYVFDHERALRYHGQLDDSRPRNAHPVTGHDLRAALDAILAGSPVARDQKPAIGCSIKWKD